MPHDNPRSENPRTAISDDNPPSERQRSERSARAEAKQIPLGDFGVRSVNAGLRMQKQIYDVFEDIGRQWLERTTAKTQLAYQLPSKLTQAGSIPAAFTAYQEWLSEWVNVLGEDNRRLINDSQRLADTGMRCLTDATPLPTT